MAQTTDDKELLLLFKQEATKEEAFTLLVKKYQQQLYWHIRRMVVDHESSNDILQDVLVKVWKNLDGFLENSSLSTWLYRIATNTCLTFLEKQKKQRNISLSDVDNQLSNKLAAEKDFDEKKIEWKLQLAIQQLPERQKLVFNLRYFEEMPYAEMSKILETTESSLKSSYHFAVKKIEDFILNN